ncbi:arylsulfatase [Candidatus Binatus sp.]|uniref:arylsulfatase n=1 Tax=Candidatus Binatus sp. TaxID=2811406 RepID=UPI003CA33E22
MNSEQAAKPNIVLVLMDNLGWGELGVYGGGILRGAPTPRLDQLATEGFRALNFNVEAQCTPSRAALMTGRYAVRTGNGTVPLFATNYGLTRWEVTLSDMLSQVGYATAIFGKWHLGDTPGRFPTDRGFDEWYGIPNSSDESFWPQSSRFRADSSPLAKFEHVMEGRKGEAPKNVKVYNLNERRMIDHELTDRAIDFMQRSVTAHNPFFAYIPYTQLHFPTLPEPSFQGKTGNGDFADVLVQMDDYAGRLLDAIDHMGVRDNTIFIFTSDNGPEMFEPYYGFSGPWRGTYFTAMEGSLRVPLLMRWPGHIPPGTISNEIIHEMDLFPTLARIAGGKVPDDRIIDGVDQLDFLTGSQQRSNRDSVIIYVGNDLFGVKWRDWKMMMKTLSQGFGEPVSSFSTPLFFDLLIDPKEEHPTDPRVVEDLWARFPITKALAEHFASLKKEPPIPPGTPDPYVPPKPAR